MQNQNSLHKMHASLTKNRQTSNSQKYIKTIAVQKMAAQLAIPDSKYLILLVSVRKHAARGSVMVNYGYLFVHPREKMLPSCLWL